MDLHADLLLSGGVVYTADPNRPWAEAVAVRGRWIEAVGRTQDLLELAGPRTELVSLEGRLLLPGFTESHLHLVELAIRATEVDVTNATSALAVAELVAKLGSRSRRGGWIRGGGWDANLWSDGRQVHRVLLDAVTGDVPVALDSKDLHSLWLNSAGLKRAAITSATPDVMGGVVERDSDGVPTGVLRDNALRLVHAVLPKGDVEDSARAVRASLPDLWSTGIVAVHNANDTPDGLALRTCQALRDQGQLGIRVLQHLPIASLDRARALGLRSGFGDARLRIGSIKIFADGALGSRTANMLAPYENEPANCGAVVTTPEELLEQALRAASNGFSVSIHAIGDAANRRVLEVMAELRRREAPAAHRLRHRIEHVQCLAPEDLCRLAEEEVIASVQPIHCTSDMDLVDRHWGPVRARSAYPFRALLDSGARLVFGSDGPIEPHSPLRGIHAAVTRRRSDGSPGPLGWQGQQRISVAEAVDAYTRWPAYAAGEEHERGTLTPGKRADLVVLEHNIFSQEPMAICNTEVDLTVLDGEVVWRRPR